MSDNRYKSAKTIAWGARMALCALIILAVAGLLYPGFPPTEMQIAPDQFSHGIIIYGISLLAALALPRLNLWLMAGLLMLSGGAVELAQLWGIIGGEAQGATC
jgi:phosphatidylserine synthase